MRNVFRVLMVVGDDPRRRYEFVQRPLEAVGVSCWIHADRGRGFQSDPSLTSKIDAIRPHVAILFGRDIRLSVRMDQVRNASNIPVVVRLGGDPAGVPLSRLSTWLANGRFMTAARSMWGILSSRKTLKRADGLIVVSKGLEKQLSRWLSDPPSMVVAPPILQLEDAAPFLERAGGPIKVVTVTNLGYKSKARGVDVLCRVLERVVEDLEQEVDFQIVGGGEHLSRLCRRWGGQRGNLKVDFTGQVECVSPFLGIADIFAYCSNLDSCPLAVLEAQIAGLPILVGSGAPASEFLHDGVDALFFNPECIADAVGTASKLLSSPSLCKSLSMGSRESAIRRCDAGDVGDILFKWLKSLSTDCGQMDL